VAGGGLCSIAWCSPEPFCRTTLPPLCKVTTLILHGVVSGHSTRGCIRSSSCVCQIRSPFNCLVLPLSRTTLLDHSPVFNVTLVILHGDVSPNGRSDCTQFSRSPKPRPCPSALFSSRQNNAPRPSEGGSTSNVLKTLTLKPGPESGRDCLMCAIFARQRQLGTYRSTSLTRKYPPPRTLDIGLL